MIYIDYKDKEKLLGHIKDRFPVVHPETGINWQTLSEGALLKSMEDFAEMPAPSWGACLPALMVWAIEQQYTDESTLLDFILIGLDPEATPTVEDRRPSLTEAQAELVYFFLAYLAQGLIHGFYSSQLEKLIHEVWRPSLDYSVQLLKETFRSSFTEVPKGPMTLFEAEAHDDYRDATPEERSLEQSRYWWEVADDHIQQCQTALHYLDLVSWKYYIPAYIKFTLDRALEGTGENSMDTVIFSLNYPQHLNRFEVFSEEQSRAIFAFLSFMEVVDWPIVPSSDRILEHWHQYG